MEDIELDIMQETYMESHLENAQSKAKEFKGSLELNHDFDLKSIFDKILYP